MDPEVAAAGTAKQQNAETGKLADDGGPGSTGDSQIQNEDQKRIQSDIQDRASHDAHHGI